MIGLQLCATLATEPEAGYREVAEFLRAGSSCPAMSGLDLTDRIGVLRRHGSNVLTLRGDLLDKRILATISVFEASVEGGSFVDDHPPGFSLHLLGGLRVADEVAGFEPDVALRLMTDALLVLATADADRCGPGALPSAVVAVVDPGDERMRARMRTLNAMRVIDPPSWMLRAALACAAVARPEIWWLTGASAKRAAQLALARDDGTPAVRADRAGTVRRLSIDARGGWLATARESLRALAAGEFELDWRPPATTLPAGFTSGAQFDDVAGGVALVPAWVAPA